MAAVALPPARPHPKLDDLDAELDNGVGVDDAIMNFDEEGHAKKESTDPMVMRIYYDRLLPFKQLYHWLNREKAVATRNFLNREITFNLPGDIFVRYNSFNGWEDFKKEVLRLEPDRFEIGPVYTARPRDKKSIQKSMFRPILRELVFDIDITDYDDVRRCCQDKDICVQCWGFISAAVDVIEATLREDFGLRHLLWVYSGRRGIHCWVSDQAAMELTDDARKSIAGYMDVVKGNKNAIKVDAGFVGANGRVLHPALRRSIDDTLEAAFEHTVLRVQDLFKAREGWERLLSILPQDDVTEKLRAKWEKAPTRSSRDKWDDVKSARTSNAKKGIWNAAIEDVILHHTYPRIDADVSKKMNHLLKSPFVVHPGTGNVCVPLNADAVKDFDPQSCPKVSHLLRELDRVKREPNTPADVKADKWKGTSLEPYVDILIKYTDGILKETQAAKRALQQANIHDF